MSKFDFPTKGAFGKRKFRYLPPGYFFPAKMMKSFAKINKMQRKMAALGMEIDLSNTKPTPSIP